ncbi:metalloprotease [Algibacter miyuki]|nr:metalloprotease [Algibacter miyuki]
MGFAQHKIYISAELDTISHTIKINQEVVYFNTSKDTLTQVLLHDWANSYIDKETPLAQRFAEDYKRNLHFASTHERGFTTIYSVKNESGNTLIWQRFKGFQDILEVNLRDLLKSGDSTTIRFDYNVKLPDDKFTGNGYTNDNNYNLRYWYLVPAVYDTEWKVHSNKDLGDYYAPLASYDIEFTIPNSYTLTSGLIESELDKDGKKMMSLSGANQREVKLYIQKISNFYHLKTEGFDLVTNISGDKVEDSKKIETANKIVSFLKDNLGDFPLEKLIVSNIDKRKNPIYGFNQLPEKFRPFSNEFQFEISLLKSTIDAMLEGTLVINPRKEKWVTDGILVYLMMRYMDSYYPEMKLGGTLSEVIGLRWFHAADLKFNDQYYLGYKNMARRFIDQSLGTPRDSLLKFNYNIANTYKAGLGFKYLEDYLEDESISKSIKKFYSIYKLKPTSAKQFQTVIQSSAKKNIDWFFDEFIPGNDKLDFKFKSVEEKGDSLIIVLKNERKNTMPVSISSIIDDKEIDKIWIDGFIDEKQIIIKKNNADKLVIDYDRNIPEVKRSNNYKNLNGVLNKPLQVRLLKDVEDPSRNQTFFMPVIEFDNIYDGLTLGGKLYNKTIITKPFIYKITPTYGFKSQALIGSVSLVLNEQFNEWGWYAYKIGLSGNRTSYAPKLFANSFTPYMNLQYRSKDLRSNLQQSITLRSVNISRDIDVEVPLETPNYSVFNARYIYSNSNFSNSIAFKGDYELSKKFSKLSLTAFYRKLFLDNRQISLRLYAGAFLKNNTQGDNGYFDFALDRPSDYLFDYGYLGRSEDEGLYSQEYITAEGGFKSFLDTRFANQWITTLNGEVSIWNWIHAYGDVGFLKNKGVNPYFAYDSGVKLSLVADYFELYFPVASNNGFELEQDKYGEKVRFKVTLSVSTLIKLFTRRWY